MKRLIPLVLAVILGAPGSRAQTPSEDMTVTPEGSAVVVDLRLHFWTENIRRDDGRTAPRIRVEGQTGAETDDANLMWPYRDILIPIPFPDVTLSVIDVRRRDEAGLLVVREPAAVRDPVFGATLVYPSEPPGVIALRKAPAVQLIRTLRDGSRRLAVVRIRPVEYEPSTDATRLIESLRFRLTGIAAGPVASTSMAARVSPFRSGSWWKIEVRDEGIYRIDRQLLSGAGIDVSALNISTVRILGNGGAPLPEPVDAARSDGPQEVARLVVDRDGDGMLDAEDAVYFYGAPTRTWRYDAAGRTFRHTINPFSEVNVYFLTVGGSAGRNMDSVASLTVPTAAFSADFQGKVFLEEDRFNLIKSGRQWYGQLFDAENASAVFVTSLTGLVPAKPIEYRFTVLTRSPANESFRIEESGQMLGRISTDRVDLNSIQGNYAYEAPVQSFTRSGALAENRSSLRLTYELASSGGKGWLNWFEILYRRKYEASEDVLLFHSPDTGAVIEYTVSGFSSRDVRLFDVTDHGAVRTIVGFTGDAGVPGKFTFQYPDTQGSVRTFLAVGPGGYKTPQLKKMENSDLSGITEGAEFVIITASAFRSDAERLQSYREQQDSLSTVVVLVDNLQNEFSAGLTDPTGIRDFLAHAASTWTVPPRYVLLFGDGHFDYRKISTSQDNYVPTYQTDGSVHYIYSYSTDDFFVQLTPGSDAPSMALGRIPANTAAEAAAAVDRIIAYESASPFDSWRNRITFVADDGLTSTGDDFSLHTGQAEELAELHTPKWFEKKKIFIVEYPTVNSASGRRKPAANSAIVEAFNRGTLIMNYTGHGNPQLWAHEAVFTREENIPQLTNLDRLCFLVTATCDFTRYDNPEERSSGEAILFLEGGGAIGVVSASRAVYADLNALFNNTLYSRLLARDSLGRTPRLGDAMWSTKQVHWLVNDLKFHLFADPTLRLVAPTGQAAVDSINGIAATTVVPVAALSRAGVSGQLLRPDGSPWSGFQGRALVEMLDAKRRIMVPEWGTFAFTVSGSLLYRGEVSVTDGRYAAAIPIPKDVSYATDRARLSVYAWDGTSDAVGFTESVVIAGTDTSAVADTVGPAISIYLEDESFRSGEVVPPSPQLIVLLEDESGMNTSTVGIGHRLEALVEGEASSRDLTDYYRGDLDTYQSGRVVYPLTGISEGHHRLTVRAWDILNNSSEAESFFEVRQASDQGILHVMNVPNPMQLSTVFTFQRASTDPVDVSVKVYSVAGRLLAALESAARSERFVEIPWDGRDDDGDRLANGVYLYKIIVRAVDGNHSQEALGKLVILR